MSKIVEHFLVPLFVIVSVLYAFNSFGSGSIELHKIYHHTTNSSAPHIERAKISLYFSHDPRVQELKSETSDNGRLRTFFLPQAVINNDECTEMVNRINNQVGEYRVTIEQVVKPVKGLQLVFSGDKEKLAIVVDRFDSIGLQKGIVFWLYNKDVLQRLDSAQNQPVLRTLWHKEKPCIAIDPGHGGRDTGAIGHHGIQEKQICLAISTHVGNLLQQQGCDVLLTRTNDGAVFLDERTLCANNKNADFFISIHANTGNPRAVGVETFCMQMNLLKPCFSHLSQEHNSCVAHVMNQRADMSYKLAQSVQRNLCNAISSFHDEPIDRKVKHSVSQVLLGVHMPAILVEVGFVSHNKEGQLLNTVEYQKTVANGICNGILAAIRS